MGKHKKRSQECASPTESVHVCATAASDAHGTHAPCQHKWDHHPPEKGHSCVWIRAAPEGVAGCHAGRLSGVAGPCIALFDI